MGRDRKSKSPPCLCKRRRDKDGAPIIKDRSSQREVLVGEYCLTHFREWEGTGSQNPRPVSAKDAETRTGHPSSKTEVRNVRFWSGNIALLISVNGKGQEVKIPALSLQKTQRQGRGTHHQRPKFAT